MRAHPCVVLVLVGNRIEPACERALSVLETRGYTVWRVTGYAAIDQGRNQVASDALAQGFEELMWIDADMAFDPDDIERLRKHALPIVCGIGVKKGKRALACHVLPETREITFGKEGGLLEILYAGAGFLFTRRQLYRDIHEKLGLPLCNQRFGKPLLPYFLPLIVPDGEGLWYLGEDYSFCHRARLAGHRVFADTTIRLGHLGMYAYTWEDAGSSPERYGTYVFTLEKPG